MVVRQTIGKPTGDICPSDLTSLTELYAWDSGITGLTGLEYCAGLRQLSLRNNKITDTSPLVANPGLGRGGEVDLRDDPLS